MVFLPQECDHIGCYKPNNQPDSKALWRHVRIKSLYTIIFYSWKGVIIQIVSDVEYFSSKFILLTKRWNVCVKKLYTIMNFNILLLCFIYFYYVFFILGEILIFL